MKALLGILLGGFLAFLALSMVQEREAFEPLFGIEPDAPAKEPVPAKADVEALLRHFHALAGHLYGSGGDPRFAERLPAAPAVSEELLSEIDYLRRNGRLQQQSLLGLELGEVESAGPGRAQVVAKEYWVVHTLGPDGKPLDPPASTVGWYRYLLSRESDRWTIMGWDLAEAPEGEGG